MSTLKIVCPDCGTALVSAAAMAEGKLVDCPNCRLLFAVTAGDVRLYDPTPRSTGTHASEVEIGVYHGSIAPPRFWEKKRRRIKRSTAELLTIYLGGAVLLLIAAVVVTTYALQLRDGTGRSTAPPPRPAANSHPTSQSRTDSGTASSETPAAAPKADPALSTAAWRDRLTGVWDSAAGPRPGLDGTGPVRWEFLADGALLTSARDGFDERTLASRWQVQPEAGAAAKLRVTGPRGSDDGEGDLYRVTWLGDGHFRLTCLSEPDVPEAEFRRGR
jgi:hypothetical protein